MRAEFDDVVKAMLDAAVAVAVIAPELLTDDELRALEELAVAWKYEPAEGHFYATRQLRIRPELRRR